MSMILNLRTSLKGNNRRLLRTRRLNHPLWYWLSSKLVDRRLAYSLTWRNLQNYLTRLNIGAGYLVVNHRRLRRKTRNTHYRPDTKRNLILLPFHKWQRSATCMVQNLSLKLGILLTWITKSLNFKISLLYYFLSWTLLIENVATNPICTLWSTTDCGTDEGAMYDGNNKFQKSQNCQGDEQTKCNVLQTKR